MSTMDLSLMLSGVDRRVARGAGSADTPLRMVLVENEALSLPQSGATVRVLSGTAWISQAGIDTLVQSGTTYGLFGAPDHAVISVIGPQPLCFEMR
jgi:hypothetical protein